MHFALPERVTQAIEHELRGIAPSTLRRRVAELSDRYRSPGIRSDRMVSSREDVAAYLAYRMPATYAAVRAAMEMSKAGMGHWHPRSLIDIGAGTGAAVVAAIDTWTDISVVRLVEPEKTMLEASRSILRRSTIDEDRELVLTASSIEQAQLREDEADLIVSSYVINEIRPSQRAETIERLWHACSGLLVVVEPGTPAGYGNILEARQVLIEMGARISAPCPHGRACPMSNEDWCHFSVRLPRIPIHRIAKTSALNYEDEKFSFVAASKVSVERSPSRVIRHPYHGKGYVKLELCTADGIERRTLSKRRDRSTYRIAKAARWGEGIEIG